ncbi:transposase domain-containing protein [Bradyrhizobium sp. BEA-2-5]|nr:transposase domain-containing protein [Bradyrhizobium sp. BEA-2-5]WOH85451.1 transposase domain-containing protein [Bradyrhizobium sp. BEA-2-5]
MNNVDPQAWLADVLARLPDHPINSVADLLPWNWKDSPRSLPPERYGWPARLSGVLTGCVPISAHSASVRSVA